MSRCHLCRCEIIIKQIREKIIKATTQRRAAQVVNNIYVERYTSGLLDAYCDSLKIVENCPWSEEHGSEGHEV